MIDSYDLKCVGSAESEPGEESDHDLLEHDDSVDVDSESGHSSRSSSIAARGSIPKEGSMELPVSLKEETKKTGKETKNGIYFSRLQKCLDISKNVVEDF